jgi:hypothetical protein
VSAYPVSGVEGRADPTVEREMEQVQQVVVAARTIRSEHDVPPRKILPLT